MKITMTAIIERQGASVYTVRMIEMLRFFFIRKYDWFISQKTSQLQIRSKSF